MKYSPAQIQLMARNTVRLGQTDSPSVARLLARLSERTGLSQGACMQRIKQLATAPAGGPL